MLDQRHRRWPDIETALGDCPIFAATNSNGFVVPRIKTKTGSKAFPVSGPALWNDLPVPIRNAKTILIFRKLLKSHIFDLAFPP